MQHVTVVVVTPPFRRDPVRMRVFLAFGIALILAYAAAADLAVGDTVTLVVRSQNIPAHPADGDRHISKRFQSGSQARVEQIGQVGQPAFPVGPSGEGQGQPRGRDEAELQAGAAPWGPPGRGGPGGPDEAAVARAAVRPTPWRFGTVGSIHLAP